MTDREKLIALIGRFCGGLAVTDITPPYGYENLADHLIANGVVVREKGEWVQRTGYVDCNRCGCFQQKPHNFCPNCGADMRKGENDGKDLL